MNLSFFKNSKKRLFLSIFLCYIFVSIIVVFSFYIFEDRTTLQNIKEDSDRISQNLRQNLILPIRNQDLSLIKKNLMAEFTQKNIQGAVLKTVNSIQGTNIIAIIKEKDGKIVEFSSLDFSNSIPMFSYADKKDVLNDNHFVGSLEIYSMNRQKQQGTINFSLLLLAELLILGTALIVLLIRILDKRIWLPLTNLNEAIISIANKNFYARANHYHPNDEMGLIYKNFNNMADTLKDFVEESTSLIWTDMVTNLPNRDRILIDIERTEKPLLILINIDFFKEINDCYGNKIGDLILKETSYRLQKLQEELQYQLYRMPADEFALLFDKEMEKDKLIGIVKMLSNIINEKPFVLNGHEINVRVTLGIARCGDIQDEQITEGKWRRLATNADMALKRAKRHQKNFIIYDESMEIPKEYENNIIWKQKLKDAIHHQRIIPFFQPIVNNTNGKVEKYESLVRLIDRQGSVIRPHHFLDLAKKSHLYDNITRAMVTKSFATFEDQNYDFSINLTVNDILDEEINGFIMKELDRNKELAGRVVFEILESEGIENYKEVMIFIEEVKDLGCKIAIDDFGSGYSNFEHIMRLDVDYIKIDSSLIKNLPYDKNAQIITKTIVNFAKELKLKTISEFVHSREVYEKSVELGVDYSQGYYFGEPKEFIL